jgi:predicted MarR family transcription regulator
MLDCNTKNPMQSQATKKTKPRTNKISALAIQTKHYSQLRNPCRIKLNSKAKEEEEEIQLRCRKPLKLETTIA